MPFIHVYGIPDTMPRSQRVDMERDIKKAVAEIPDLELTEKQVTCYLWVPIEFVGDICVKVEGLFDNPKRTEAVRNILAQKLVAIARAYFPKPFLCECLIDPPFNPALGVRNI